MRMLEREGKEGETIHRESAVIVCACVDCKSREDG